MKGNLLKYITTFLLLVYLVMQLLCVLPNDNKRQVVFLMWLVCAYLAYTPLVRQVLRTKGVGYLYAFVVFYGLSMLINHSVVYAISAMLGMMELFSPFLMYRIVRAESKAVQRLVFITITAVFMANVAVCFIYMRSSFTNYGLRDIEAFTEYNNTFYFLYAIAILVPVILYYLSHSQREGSFSFFKAIIGYGICLVLAYFVLKAQFMTAIVLMFVGGVFALVQRNRGLAFTIPIVAVIVLAIFSQVSNDLIRIADENNATAVSSRLEEIQHILANDTNNAEDYTLRQDLSQNSFETFLENPLIGVLYKYENIDEAKHQGVGNHAEWLDTLARYGLFGILLLVFIVKAMRTQRKVVNVGMHYLLFALLGFLNPTLGFVLTCAVFLYMPLLGRVCFSER